MYEVEVKVPADLERVRTRLAELEIETTPQGAVVQRDTYYDAPHRSFPETDEALRIRTERRLDAESESKSEPVPDDASETDTDADARDTTDEETRVTYKGPLVDDESKTREEVETAVADGEKLDAILTNLGFEAAATVRKERERFTVTADNRAVTETDDPLPDEFSYTITLDTVDAVGEYVEVETEVENDDALEAARDGAYAVLERLELDPEDQLRTSYLGLLLES